jgi:PPM family protein phosphatase
VRSPSAPASHPKRLRTYAAEGLLLPAAVDPASGYRYYSSEQLAGAGLIDALRQAGIPLAQIRAFLAGPSLDRLDGWAEQLESEATDRRAALDAARVLTAQLAEIVLQPATDKSGEGTMETLHSAGRTETGAVRENNEDVVVSAERLAVVADGMGGHPGGETASGAAAGILEATFVGHAADELTLGIRAANRAIWDRAAGHPELEGMGTTLCAVGLLDDGRLSLAHVGDRRIYLWRAHALTRLTRDHSVTAEMVERGELTADEARGHAHYGVLTCAVGVGPDVVIDSSALRPEPGDRVLLCSDGLFNELSEEEITADLAGNGDLGSVVDALVDKALGRGGHDNVSAVVAQVGS